MEDRIKIKRLPPGWGNPDENFYAEVDGEKVGEKDKPFWKTAKEAWRCGFNYICFQMNLGKDKNGKDIRTPE